MDCTPGQLDLFDEENECTLLRRELAALRQQCAKWQKNILSKHHQLAKLCLHVQEENCQLQRRLQALEKALQQSSTPESQHEDDYMVRLFAAAYLAPS